MTHLKTLSLGLCLGATATACLDAGFIREASNADTWLLKHDYYPLADNQVTHTTRHRSPLRERRIPWRPRRARVPDHGGCRRRAH